MIDYSCWGRLCELRLHLQADLAVNSFPLLFGSPSSGGATLVASLCSSHPQSDTFDLQDDLWAGRG